MSPYAPSIPFIASIFNLRKESGIAFAKSSLFSFKLRYPLSSNLCLKWYCLFKSFGQLPYRMSCNQDFYFCSKLDLNILAEKKNIEETPYTTDTVTLKESQAAPQKVKEFHMTQQFLS